MTKPTVSKLFKYSLWLLPVLLLTLPIWAVIRKLLPPQNSTVTQALLPPSRQPLLASPFLNVKPSPNPVASLPQPMPKSAPVQSILSKTEIARRSQLTRAALFPNVDSSVGMHVLIASGVSFLNLGVSPTGKLFNSKGKLIQTLSVDQSYRIQVQGGSMAINGRPVPEIIWVVPNQNGIVYLGDRGYRGILMLGVEGGQIWAVNYVSLRHYLYSVVGAEVSSSWPMAALKAQAIAARSYALTYHFKPVNQLYDLGSDEYYQVYKGIESEADTTRIAVEQTAGAFVSYRGGIVESLYAASDDIVSEAFQGHGMSQLGALDLAQQGYTYEQILQRYYPKTKVGRIEVDQE